MTLLKNLEEGVERLKPSNDNTRKMDRIVKTLSDAEQMTLARVLDKAKQESKDLTDEAWLVTRTQEQQAVFRKVLARLEVETLP